MDPTCAVQPFPSAAPLPLYHGAPTRIGVSGRPTPAGTWGRSTGAFWRTPGRLPVNMRVLAKHPPIVRFLAEGMSIDSFSNLTNSNLFIVPSQLVYSSIDLLHTLFHPNLLIVRFHVECMSMDRLSSIQHNTTNQHCRHHHHTTKCYLTHVNVSQCPISDGMGVNLSWKCLHASWCHLCPRPMKCNDAMVVVVLVVVAVVVVFLFMITYHHHPHVTPPRPTLPLPQRGPPDSRNPWPLSVSTPPHLERAL